MFDWYWFVVYYLIHLHLMTLAHSLYEHRGLHHGYFKFSKPLEYAMRIILWSGNYYWPNCRKFLGAQHRYHHVVSDTPADPNSPYNYTFLKMFDVVPSLPGKMGYVSPEIIEKYGKDIQEHNDWLEHNITGKFWKYGIYFIHIPLTFILYGPLVSFIAVIIFKIQRRYGMIFLGNYVFHKWPIYYSFKNMQFGSDKSRNISPFSLLTSGEGLHQNHHGNPGCPKFSKRWYEIDFGWVYVKIFMFFNLIELTERAKIGLISSN